MVSVAVSGILLKQSGVCIYIYIYKTCSTFIPAFSELKTESVTESTRCSKHWLWQTHAQNRFLAESSSCHIVRKMLYAKCFTQNADLLELFPGHLSRMCVSVCVCVCDSFFLLSLFITLYIFLYLTVMYSSTFGKG